jgi:3-hydroxyacyl-CoA dehydrogenase
MGMDMKDLYKIGVLGAGTMAPQIALFLAQSGYSVVIRNRKNTKRVLKYFESKLAIIAQKKV